MRFTFGTVNLPYAAKLATAGPDEDGPVYMVNFMRYKEFADYGDQGGPAISGREADDIYAPVDVLHKLGCHIGYFGDVTALGDDEVWDRMAIVRYPTRRSFMEMQERADFQERAVHKEAGMDFTIILAALPLSVPASVPRDAKTVSFIATPEGQELDLSNHLVARLEVEDLVIGDERRFTMLHIVWGEIDLSTLPLGVLAVQTRTFLDTMPALMAENLS